MGEPERWRDLARELGGVIGRSQRPICFLLGAGASLSSGSPTTEQVAEAFRNATGERFHGMDLMRMIQTLPEDEKQEILSPLFSSVRPGLGYLAMAALAKHRRVVVLNLNWDDALDKACGYYQVEARRFDIAGEVSTRPVDIIEDPRPRLYNIHLHGMLGVNCRFGTLETISFSSEAEEYLVRNGLSHTMACLGASINEENDLPQLFRRWIRKVDAARPSSQHWYFVRGSSATGADDRMRQSLTFSSPTTYVRAPDVDFDSVVTLLTDTALAIASDGGSYER